MARRHVDRVRGVHVRIYGRADRETFVIAPRLHYAGPDDPRLDRFCRVLASAGHLVIAPFVPGYLRLIPGRDAIADFGRVLDEAPRWELRSGRTSTRDVGKPVVFSISFGSLLALATAAVRGDDIARLVIFGGYADFHATMKFCLSGVTGSGRACVRDPLNQPVVMMNLLPHLAERDADRAELAEGWRRYVERTWGRPELKEPALGSPRSQRSWPRASPEHLRELFLIGIGARAPAPKGARLPRARQVRRSRQARSADLTSRSIRGRVDLVHGADDDVIPFEQTHALAAGLTHADVRTHITGLYGHTGSVPSDAARRSLREMATDASHPARAQLTWSRARSSPRLTSCQSDTT